MLHVRKWVVIFGGLLVCFVGCTIKPELLKNLKKQEESDLSGSEAKHIFKGRQVSINALSFENRPLVKVVMIIDDSSSMQDEQINLSQGVSKMLGDLQNQNMDMDFILYTTSSHIYDSYQKSVNDYKYTYITWNVDGTEMVRANEPTWQEAIPFMQRSVWPLKPPVGGEPISFRRTMTSIEFNAQRERLQYLIETIGTNGSNTEAGFCSLGRILSSYQDLPNPFFEKGQKLVVIIISDGDDNSSIQSCLQKREYRYKTIPRPQVKTSTSLRQEAVEWYYQPRFRLIVPETQWYAQAKYDSTCYQDGQPISCEQSITQSFNPTTLGNPPESSSNIPCSSELEAWMQASIQNKLKPDSCTYRAQQDYRNRYFSFNDTEPLRDLCQESFTYQNSTYSNIIDYFFRTQAVALQGYELYGKCSDNTQGTKWILGSPYQNDGAGVALGIHSILSADAETLEEGILIKIRELFGEDGFFFSAIIDDADFDKSGCTQGSSEENGVKYRNFISSLSSQGEAYPICSPSYYPALEKVRAFIDRVVALSYVVDLSLTEIISEVWLQRATQLAPLQLGQDFEIFNNTIDLKEGILQEGDHLIIEIVSPSDL